MGIKYNGEKKRVSQYQSFGWKTVECGQRKYRIELLRHWDRYTGLHFILSSVFCYLRRRLASESIVPLGVTLCVCPPSRLYHVSTDAALVSAAKVMRCIQCPLVGLLSMSTALVRINCGTGMNLPKYAERFAEDPRIGGPDGIRLLRQSEHQHQQVWDGEVEETVVGRRVHVVIAGDDHTRRHVADQSSHEYQSVDDSHRHRRRDILPPRTKQQFQINGRRHVDRHIH